MSSVSQAIKERRLVSFTYDGYLRTVEPHTHGVDTKGHNAMRAYQVSGGSVSGERHGWKLFHMAAVSDLVVLSKTFSGPRRGYKRGDNAFRLIHAQL